MSAARPLTAAAVMAALALAGCGSHNSSGSSGQRPDPALRAGVSRLCQTAATRAAGLRTAQQRAQASGDVRRIGAVVEQSSKILSQLANAINVLLPRNGQRALHFYATTLVAEAARLHDLAVAIAHRQTARLRLLAPTVGALAQLARNQAATAGLSGCGETAPRG